MTIALWIVFSIIVGAIASGKNRSGIGYFFISLLLSPLIGLVIVAVQGDNKEDVEKTVKKDEEERW